MDVKQVGRELGVRYVLEGSVRKAANRVRISGQLIDAATGAHLWADRFDSALEDIFDLQDRVTTSVVGAIAPKLEQAEIERAKRKPTESLDAYDCYLRGVAHVHSETKEGISEALRLFYEAIELDPDFAAAYGWAASCYVRRKRNNWMADRAQETAEAEQLARRAAMRLSPLDPLLHSTLTALAFVHFYAGRYDEALSWAEQALQEHPDFRPALRLSAASHALAGRLEEAHKAMARFRRLEPGFRLSHLKDVIQVRRPEDRARY
jgi:tetratricopeptide (TPR) repeat protein